MNTVLSAWTPESIPAGWTDVRSRWELGHAMQAALFLFAFISLVLAQQRRPMAMTDNIAFLDRRGSACCPAGVDIPGTGWRHLCATSRFWTQCVNRSS
jgi:hypothetical protein